MAPSLACGIAFLIAAGPILVPDTSHPLMETFHRILRGAIEAGASDIHLKAGAPVTYRISRDLLPVDAPAPTPEWIDTVLAAIVPAALRERFEREQEVDFAYA